MKKITVFCIIFFTGLMAIGQPDKEKLEQLKAQTDSAERRFHDEGLAGSKREIDACYYNNYC